MTTMPEVTVRVTEYDGTTLLGLYQGGTHRFTNLSATLDGDVYGTELYGDWIVFFWKTYDSHHLTLGGVVDKRGLRLTREQRNWLSLGGGRDIVTELRELS